MIPASIREYPMTAHVPLCLGICLLALLVSGCTRLPEIPACTDPLGCVIIKPQDPVKIGVLQSLTGGVASNGQVQVNSIRLAVNDRGGNLLDHPIQLEIQDTRCTPEGGTAAATKIALDLGIVGAIGTHCSGAAATASKIISEAGMVMISGANSAPSLTSVQGKSGANWHPGYYRVMFNGTNMARAAAWFAFRKHSLNRAAVINDGDLYTREFTDEFSRAFTELGGTVALSTSINKGDRNMEPVITALVLSGAECVYFPIYEPEAQQFVNQVRARADASQVLFIGGGALVTEAFIRSCGSNAAGMYFATVVPPQGPACDRLSKMYRETFGSPPQHFSFAHAYDAANLLMTVLEAVAVVLPDKSLSIGRQALRNAMSNTRDFPGITGGLSCDQFGDCSADRFNIVRLDDPLAGLEGLKSNVIYTYNQER
ncbi:MAG: branched-chain amino acid ABC transporter substrate-binding protein [Pseudomonadota bacterium]